ncbi:MAG: 2Fe-2S iron-sulfur cluster binding domain-containing protein [Gemmataceae bacterium]|nr:2Fe-2S iron-sulfur cluster binding domain-containing protein [Gemmataceae bacterium]
MKTLVLAPINEEVTVPTQSSILQALLAKELEVPMACKGKGVCATCHVHIRAGHDRLTPRTDREKKTLGFITGADPSSRLACQCRILGEGVVVELPKGMYIERAEDLIDLVGTRAAQNILHPINGSILIAEGKLITRSRIEELKRLNVEMDELHSSIAND